MKRSGFAGKTQHASVNKTNARKLHYFNSHTGYGLI